MDVPHNLQHIQALTEKIVDYAFISYSIQLVIHYLLLTSVEKFNVNFILHEFHREKIKWGTVVCVITSKCSQNNRLSIFQSFNLIINLI